MNSLFFKDPSEALATGIVALCGILLCAALVMEYGSGLLPCPLCLMQRIWFFFAGLAAFIGLLHNPKWGIYPFSTIAAAIIGGGFSLRQLWLQSLPADQVPSCGPDMTYMFENFPLSEILVLMTQGTGDCAEVSFQFGLTLPGWALVGFLGVMALSLLQWRVGSH